MISPQILYRSISYLILSEQDDVEADKLIAYAQRLTVSW